ncbi:unnamed protein product [Nezara viridula]|uniref:Uncharacterized protein n=1 Tax=Nezara viridula TaxID=85310 RepID=A0A9P0E589_NEZVI|nr:unnamed protein product [Nezara viridula]
MAKPVEEIIVEGKNISDYQWPAVQKLIIELTEALLLERGERTKSRKECDVIRTFWQNTEKDYEEAKALVMKKYLEVSVVWDKHKEPYHEKEQEITFQKFILDFDADYQDKENQKRIEQVVSKWDKEILPKMMEAKTQELMRADKKQDELNKEYKEAQKEYEKLIEEAVKKADDKMLDWQVLLYQRTLVRKRYQDLQFLLEKFFCCEQKNLLIHDLKAAHKVNFEKIRSFIRERVEGDLLQIISLSQNIAKQNEEFQSTSKDINVYKEMVKAKQSELDELNKSVKISELRLNSFKQNVDVATRCFNKMEKLNKEKEIYEKRKKELEEEVKRRQKEKHFYLNMLQNLKIDVKNLQEQYLGDIFDEVMDTHIRNLKEFDNLFEQYENKHPESARMAKEQLVLERSELEKLPLLITKEIKGHNDFIESTMEKLKEMGMQRVPQFVHVSSESYPTATGPAGLTCI